MMQYHVRSLREGASQRAEWVRIAVRPWFACAFVNRSDMPPFLGLPNGPEPATHRRTRAAPGTRHRCKYEEMVSETAEEGKPGEEEAYLAATLKVRQITPGPAVLMAVLGRVAWPLRADLMEPFMAALDLGTLEPLEPLGPLSDPFVSSILGRRRLERWWSRLGMSSTEDGWGFLFRSASKRVMESMGCICRDGTTDPA